MECSLILGWISHVCNLFLSFSLSLSLSFFLSLSLTTTHSHNQSHKNHIYMHMSVCVCVSVSVYILWVMYVFMCVRLCMYTSMWSFSYVCVCVCVCARKHNHLYLVQLFAYSQLTLEVKLFNLITKLSIPPRRPLKSFSVLPKSEFSRAIIRTCYSTYWTKLACHFSAFISRFNKIVCSTNKQLVSLGASSYI